MVKKNQVNLLLYELGVVKCGKQILCSKTNKGLISSLKKTVLFVTAYVEIFHCMHHLVILESDLYFTFCYALNALSKRTSK